MNTFSEVIDVIGIKPLAEALAIAESHVRTMKARDSIPPEYWPAIMGLRPEVTFQQLMAMRAAKKSSSASSPTPNAADDSEKVA